jgi:F-type H+/Na+-transporting ATPase subunit alpha
MRNDDVIAHQHQEILRFLAEYPAALVASRASGPDVTAGSWLQTARAALGGARLGARAEEIGRVEEVGDGIALVSGLPNVRLDELLQFQKGQFGFAQVLERDRIGCVVLDDVDGVEAGDTVRGTGDVARVPVGAALLGRVVDPLGRPLDGKGPIATEAKEPIERPAPSIIDRDAVVQPVQTGLIVVDALFALGRGQRELIIGDRAIGKTTIGIDTIINQKTSDMICVYVAVGQKSSSVRRAIDSLHGHAAVDRCIIVVAEAASSPGLQWIAPFAGFTMAEYFRDRGQHALVVIDDLTKHAATHREIALLTRQSPGREAYPGDVFYVHARLLERAAKLSKEKGGGSLTALPIAETDAGNLSAYIPTNLISITDGQIALDTKLFYEGQKPAVDVGTSVSRVGGKTQAHALREAAETVRLDYAQFLELETFTRFGGMPEGRVRDQLTRGARIRAILSQARHAPVRLADEVALVLAVQSGLLDGLPLPAVATFRLGLTDALDRGAADSVKSIEETGTIDGTRKKALLDMLKQYVQSVAPPRTGETTASEGDKETDQKQQRIAVPKVDQPDSTP